VIEMPNFATDSAFSVPVPEPLCRASLAATEHLLGGGLAKVTIIEPL